jgi:hypothetical protein
MSWLPAASAVESTTKGERAMKSRVMSSSASCTLSGVSSLGAPRISPISSIRVMR